MEQCQQGKDYVSKYKIHKILYFQYNIHKKNDTFKYNLMIYDNGLITEN